MASGNSVHIEGSVKRDASMVEVRPGIKVMDFCLVVDDPMAEGLSVYVDCYAPTDAVNMLDGFVSEGERLGVDGALTFRTVTDRRGARRTGMNVYVENVYEIGE